MSNFIQNGGELSHYGILGMKWGVRRAAKKTSTGEKLKNTAKTLLKPQIKIDGPQKTKIPKNTKIDGVQKRKLPGPVKSAKENPVKKMSDQELRQRINRIQMEKQYAQLTKKEKRAGEKFVKEVLANAAKQTATNYVSKYMSKGVDLLINKTTKSK